MLVVDATREWIETRQLQQDTLKCFHSTQSTFLPPPRSLATILAMAVASGADQQRADVAVSQPPEEVIHIQSYDSEGESAVGRDDGQEQVYDVDPEQVNFNLGTLHVWDEDSDDEGENEPQTEQPTIPSLRLGENMHDMREDFPHMWNWWRTLLIGSAAPGTLTMGHVTMNLYSSSLNPGVLLAIPVYFSKTEVGPGMIVLALVALLSIFGGGLWVSLGRYVGGHTIESITSKAFGMNTRWKRNIGHGVGSIALVAYCTGAAVIAYHAMTDLLLQVFYHYTTKGQLFHDRAFVTLAVGGFLTLPLLLSTTPKRNMHQIQSWAVLLFYPAIIGILLIRLNEWIIPGVHKGSVHLPERDTTIFVPRPHLRENTWPWATTAMLPLLTLSASPAQILAHYRSLRRRSPYESNVMLFFMAQLLQVMLMLLVTYVLGVHIGLVGTAKLEGDLHANFFNALPLDDDYINLARILFAFLLAAHLTVCLASARSCWSRLLNLLNLHPLRAMLPPTPHIIRRRMFAQMRGSGSQDCSPAFLPPSRYSPPVSDAVPEQALHEVIVWQRFKTMRNVIAGIVLWCITAFTAYFSGVGGVFRRNEKEGEELRFLRSIEYIGIIGAIVGFVLPAVNWLVLFKIRRPRAILLLQTKSMSRRISRYLLSPLSTLIGKSTYPSGEDEPLLEQSGRNEQASNFRRSSHSMRVDLPNHLNEHTANNCDDATLILLARKERELQRKSRGRRRFQELLVVVALIPFGLFLVIAALIELQAGGY